MAVTHLPQVAACADRHWVVSKQLQGNSTVSSVAEVQNDARTAEVARMLGGDIGSATTAAHADEMLRKAAV
jgi:DNA repair protein RecN (Recombination protein N)